MTPERARNLTLDQLDPPAWGEPDFDSGLVRACHRLRRKPLGEFTVEDLRIMIGQQICLRWLVPLALEVLEKDPLAEGDYFAGDLLCSVLKSPVDFWAREPQLRSRLSAVLDELGEMPKEISERVAAFRAHLQQ
ncbi:MAG: contact-dependent growth inhibition system immunity protein [Phycisphaerales bacterium]